MIRKFAAVLMALCLGFGSLSLRAAEKVPETNTSPAVYKTFGDLEKKAADWPDVKKYTTSSVVIPGLKESVSRSHFSGKLASCHAMTPQGVTVMGDKLLISAYCHNYVHDSVLFVLDKDSGKYLKMVVLDGMPHVGSIAYDAGRDGVWVAAHSNNHASANFLAADKIEHAGDGEKLGWDTILDLKGLPEDSYLTMDGEHLVAGTFEKTGSVHIRWYDPDTREVKREAKSAYKSVKAGTNIQGIAIKDDRILVSASDGPHLTSTLTVYSLKNGTLDVNDAQKTYDFPPRAEQVWADGSTLYMCFEGGASEYRREGAVHMDRILCLDLDKLL